MSFLYAVLLLLGAPVEPVPPDAPPAQQAPAKPAIRDGHDVASAIEVKSVGEEYEILRRLGLKPKRQSLIMIEGRPYDMIRAVDKHTGRERDLWFDIESFFGKELGF